MLGSTENGEIVENLLELENDSREENIVKINDEVVIDDAGNTLEEGGQEGRIVTVVTKVEIVETKQEPVMDEAADQETEATGEDQHAEDKQAKDKDEDSES